jgi:hypothetical protein
VNRKQTRIFDFRRKWRIGLCGYHISKVKIKKKKRKEKRKKKLVTPSSRLISMNNSE